jgi:flagellar protein FliO/FliZ
MSILVGALPSPLPAGRACSLHPAVAWATGRGIRASAASAHNLLSVLVAGGALAFALTAVPTALLTTVLTMTLAPAHARAEAFPRTLEDIKVFGRGEAIQLIFSQPYEGLPSEEHAPGRMALTFAGVGSAKPVRDLRPREESLYREIKVVQYSNSTTVTFLLRDPTLNLKNRVSLSHDKNKLNLELRLDGAAEPAAPLPFDSRAAGDLRAAREPLLAELEQKIAGMPASKAAPAAPQPVPAPPATSIAQAEPAPPARPAPAAQATGAPATGAQASGPQANGPAAAPAAAPAPAPAGSAAPLGLGGMPESNFFATLATMVIGLAVMLGALYGVLVLYRRAFRSRLARFAGTPAVRQLASFSIGPRQRIVILEINGEWIACGVTPSQITFLTRLSGAQPAAPAAASAPAEVAPGVAPEPEAAAPAGKADPVHQFAEVLKQKVRSLKRIN